MSLEVCPVCSKTMEPTRSVSAPDVGGGAPQQIPMDFRCPDRCDQRTDPTEYRRLLVEQHSQSSGTPDNA
jgi:hypothetical protein